MKKILTFLFILVFSSALLAQSDFRLGIQATPTTSWMSTNDNLVTSNGSRLGMNLGFMAEYYFADNYSIVSGASILFNQGGGLTYNYAGGGNYVPRSAAERRLISNAVQYDSLSMGTTINYGVQYVEIPLSIRLRTNEFGYLRYFAELPMFSIAIKTKALADIMGNTYGADTEKENVSTDLNPITLKWGLGGGVEYSISPDLSLIGGVFYNGSLIDIVKNNKSVLFDSGLEEASKANLHSISIRIGVLF